MADEYNFLDYAGLSEFKSSLNGVDIVSVTGDGKAYTGTIPNLTALKTGMIITIIPDTSSATTIPTLNLNALGAKNIKQKLSINNSLTVAAANEAWMIANKPLALQYDGTQWVTMAPRSSASDIYGTLPVANGGTGATSAAAALTNLGLTATAKELNYCDGVTSNIQTQINTLSSEKVGEARVNELIAAATGGDATTTTVLSDNLFDKSAITEGKIFYHNSAGISLVDNGNSFYAYVPLRGAGTYRTIIRVALWGEMIAKRVPILKEDNTFLQNAAGTLTYIDDANAYLEFTVTAEMVNNGAAIYAYSGTTNAAYAYNVTNAMIVKDREYPSTYIPYGYIEVEVGGAKAENTLSGKTAVFLGDSICAGTTTLADATEYGYGWGGIIGEGNNMSWKNYGRNGGTITPISSVAEERWVPSQVDLAIATYSTVDYVIFEGGCNDADLLGASGLGTLSDSGYAPSSTDNFTGAFETLVLKILNAYPTAKVGYVIPPKMYLRDDFSATGHIHRQFFDRAVEICEKWGIPVLDLWKGNPLNPKLSVYYDSSLTAYEANTNGKCYTDGQHLTLTGYQRITPQIEAFMRTL